MADVEFRLDQGVGDISNGSKTPKEPTLQVF